MTTTSAQEFVHRPRERVTIYGAFEMAFGAVVAANDTIQWPSPRYREDPCGFAEEILGAKLWERQREILEAIRDCPRVAVASGHKVSKSHTAAVAALWFFCSHAAIIATSDREYMVALAGQVVTVDGGAGFSNAARLSRPISRLRVDRSKMSLVPIA